MRKSLKIIILIFLLAGAGLVTIILVHDRNKQVPVAQPENVVKASVTVSPIDSQVFVATTTLADFAEVKTQAQFTENDHLKTSHTGKALVEGTHTAIVDSDSEIVLASLNPQESKTGIKLESGNIWARIQKLFDKGEYYEIETKNAKAVVRGTSFGVGYVDETSTLIVTEGAVAFSVKKDQGDDTAGSEVLVIAGTKAWVKGSGSIATSSITESDTKSPWFIYNNQHYIFIAPKKAVPAATIKPKTGRTLSTPTKSTSTSTVPKFIPIQGQTSPQSSTTGTVVIPKSDVPPRQVPVDSSPVSSSTNPNLPPAIIRTQSPQGTVLGTSTPVINPSLINSFIYKP